MHCHAPNQLICTAAQAFAKNITTYLSADKTGACDYLEKGFHKHILLHFKTGLGLAKLPTVDVYHRDVIFNKTNQIPLA